VPIDVFAERRVVEPGSLEAVAARARDWFLAHRGLVIDRGRRTSRLVA